MAKANTPDDTHALPAYSGVHSDIVALLESARRAAARSVNALMTASYWEIGRRIVEYEQGGRDRASYGDALIVRLAKDLTQQFGRGFSRQNLQQMRLFYLAWPADQIRQTASGEFTTARISQAASAASGPGEIAGQVKRSSETTHFTAPSFPLPWSAYVRLLSVRAPAARSFYEAEALRCGWSVRQLDRQINSQFYERVALSRNKAAMLHKGERVDLLFFHRRLQCLLVIDLKLGKFSHADAGQMHMYLNYAREHWMKPGENPPVGLVLCTSKGRNEAHYALDGLPNQILAAQYRTVLPEAELLEAEFEKTLRELEARRPPLSPPA